MTYLAYYMRMTENDNFGLNIEVFIPEEGITYPFKRDKPRSIDDAAGNWKSIEELADWKLIHVLTKNLMLIGLFEKSDDVSSLVLEERIPEINLNILLSRDQTMHRVKEIVDEDIPKQETVTSVDITTVKMPSDFPPPTPRIIYMFDRHDASFPITNDKKFCKICKSSLKLKFFGRTRGCIQPLCENYWKNH